MHAAMELLLVQPDINDDETIEDVQEEAEAPPATVPLYSRHGPFVSFRQYRQQRFQPNPKVEHPSERNRTGQRKFYSSHL